MTFDVRLVAYTPNGARLGVLPHPIDLSVAVPLNDTPSLTLSYTTDGACAEWLANPVEVALERQHDLAWTEIPGGRFVRIARSDDETDPTGVRQYDCPGYLWLLRKARVWPSPADNPEGKRPFLSAPAGVILRTLIDEAKTRGALPGLTVDFDTAQDSAGAPWDKILTVYYEPGIDLFTVLTNLADQGVCDFVTEGRTLRVFNAETTLARDLTTPATLVDLHIGRDVTEAPDSGTIEDLLTDVLIVGDEGASLALANPSVTSPWGRWEALISQGGVSDTGTMTVLAQATLDLGSQERVQSTRGLDFTTARFLPWVHYGPGDLILAPGDAGTNEPLRVRQVTIARDNQGVVSGNVVLNDRFIEREIRLSRRVTGITGGSVQGGGSGARPAPEGPDKRTPAAPLGLVVSSTAYLDPAGNARAIIAAQWDAVTTATDATALDVASYDVSVRQNVTGTLWHTADVVDTPAASLSPYDIGKTFLVRVRARGQYTAAPGLWSSAISVTTAVDTTPPPVPSTPVLTTRLGTISVAWDGAPAMPADFDRVEIAMSAAPNAAVVLDSLRSAGKIVVTGQPYNQTRYFRLRAVDRSGNASAWSAEASIATVPLVAVDLIGRVINEGNVALGAVTADLIADGAVRDVALADAAVTLAKIAGGAVDATKLSPAVNLSISDAQADATAAQDTADVALTSANGKNKITFSLYTPPVEYVGPAGDVWFQRFSSGIMTGQWEWNGYSWAARTLADSMIANLNAGKITAGFLAAARIQAGTVTAEKLVVSSGENLVEDGDGRSGTATSWPGMTVDTADKPPGAYASFVQPPAITTSRIVGGTFPVAPGAQYLVELWAKALDVGSNLYVQLQGFDAAGAGVPTASAWIPVYAVGNVVVPIVWTKYSIVMTAGEFTRSSRVTLYPNHPNGAATGQSFAGLVVRPLIGSTLIQDGAITTDTLAANAVVADKIAANAVVADKIAANAVEADKIAANAVTAAKINAGAVEADKIAANAVVADKIAANAVDASKIRAGSITADRLLIGGSANMIPNGAGEWGALGGWSAATALTFDTSDAPAGLPGSFKSSAGQSLLAQSGAQITVEPGAEYLFEVWLKADKPNSTMILEVKDDSGNLAVTQSAAVAGASYPGADPFLVTTLTLPTVWTRYAKTFKAPSTSRTINVSSIIFNHSSGSERTAVQSLAGLRMRTRTSATLITDGAVTTDKIVANAVTAGKVDALAINAGHLQANAVTADKIEAGAITAEKVAAGSITADRLLVGSTANLIPNGAGEWGALGGWSTTTLLTFDTTDVPSGLPGSFKSQPGQGTATQSREQFVVEPSTEYVFEVWLKADKPNSAMYLEVRDQSGLLAGGAPSSTIPGATSPGGTPYMITALTLPTVWTYYAKTFTTPAGAHAADVAAVYFNHSIGAERTAVQSIAGMRIRRRVGATLITDGAITTGKIDANAITADKISATAIDGKVITGATVRTAASGSRVQLTTSGVDVYDGSTLMGRMGNMTSVAGWGLEVRDPVRGQLAPVSTVLFGARGYVQNSGITFNVSDGADSGWNTDSGTNDVALFNSLTGRFAVTVTAYVDWSGLNGRWYMGINVARASDGVQIIAPHGYTAASVATVGTQSGRSTHSYTRLITTDPGAYAIRGAYFIGSTGSGSSMNTVTTLRTVTVIPC